MVNILKFPGRDTNSLTRGKEKVKYLEAIYPTGTFWSVNKTLFAEIYHLPAEFNK